jgi:sodium-dependent dicarboxylate transporter 2/3/5
MFIYFIQLNNNLKKYFSQTQAYMYIYKKFKLVKHNYLNIIIGIILSCLVYVLVEKTYTVEAAKMSFVVILMAYYWISEAIPLPVTSLFPIVLFPLLNISDLATTTSFYGKPVIYLFLGGFMLALALEKTNLHERIALLILKKTGGKPSQLILGFMLASAFLSMWISNTAAVMVMLPIGVSVITEAKNLRLDEKLFNNLAIGLMLGIAYAANVGGMATLVGTAPNMIFKEIYEDNFHQNFGFNNWLTLALPLTIMLFAIIWFTLTKIILRQSKQQIIEKTKIDEKYKALGKITPDEKRTAFVFLLAIFLWLTGNNIQISETITLKGWRELFSLHEFKDASVAIFSAILLFVIPSKKAENNKSILEWHDTQKTPWGILLLFGGGFALAGGFVDSGLSDVVTKIFTNIQSYSTFSIIMVTSLIITFVTEITSNTAITTLTMPILASIALTTNISPLLLMFPATISASCAFMMPTATPPQAIIYGSGYVPIRVMNKTGLFINLISAFIITIYTYLTV